MPEKPAKPSNVWITPEVDREMSRRFAGFFVRIIVLLLGLMAALVYLYTHIYVPMKYRSILNGVVAGIYFVPVAFWWRSHFIRLRAIGRELYDAKRYEAAVKALEPFTRFGNRSFDADGESHYFLADAYRKLGDTEHSREAGAFLERSRRGSKWQKAWSEETDAPAVIKPKPKKAKR